MNLRDMPIRRKLMFIILLTSGAVMLLMRGSFFVYEYMTFRQLQVRQISSLGGILAANSTAALAFDNPDDGREILSALRADRHVAAAALYDSNGRLFARFPEDAREETLPARPEPPGHRFVDSGLVSHHAVNERDRHLGTLYLRFDTRAAEQAFFWGSLKIAAAVMAVVLLFAYLLSRTLQRQISGPIVALAGTARAISERGDYSVRAAQQGRDEIGLLTNAFNQMLGQIQGLTLELEARVARRTAQLEAANKELEAFSYSVSHDLRAPLRHINGFVGLLIKSDGATVSPRGRGYLDTISESARHMGQLIDDLLVFARMGRAEMRIGRVDLTNLLEEVLHSLQPDIQNRNIVWQKEPLPVVQADRAMVRQVLFNLLANALKYSRPRDPAVIEIGCREDAPGEFVVFVRDNGVGFDMKYADKLFGVFQRLHRAEEFEGTGIGLANVRRIIIRHGGRVWAESQPGAGATFYFSLPQSPGNAIS